MDDLTKQLAAEYHLSALRKEAEVFPRSQDREKYQMISKRFETQVKAQTRAYEHGYEKRVRMASEHICQRHGRNLSQVEKRQDGEGLALQKRIKREAHREVQSDHLRRVALIRNHEAKELKELVDTVRQREKQEKPKMITDQRSESQRQTIRRTH